MFNLKRDFIKGTFQTAEELDTFKKQLTINCGKFELELKRYITFFN